MIFRFLTIITVMLLSGCESSNGSGEKKPNSGAEIPPEAYLLGGVISGLKGNIVIANGDETLTLDKDGSFVFAKKIPKGNAYDVKIVALPQDQLCELRNSRNYLYRNRTDVIIECANLMKRQVQINVPNGYSLADLRLLSNFEALGGSGENPLAETNEITVFENSFITLLNSDNEILFISFIDSTANTSFELNSKSTAKALLLLESNLSAGIHDRNTSVTSIQNTLFGAANIEGDLDLLAEKIQKLVEAGGNLSEPGQELTEPLNRAVIYSALTLSRINLIPRPISSNSSNTSLVKLSKIGVSSPTETSGIQLTLTKIADTGKALSLDAKNNFSRFVSIDSTTFDSQLIDPNGTLSITLQNGLESQQILPVHIAGPGQLGNINTENLNNVLDASIATGVGKHFLPSINLLLGLKNASQFSTQDCLSVDTINMMRSRGKQITTIKDMASNKAWYKFFSTLNNELRDNFSKKSSSANVSPVEELYACEKFGAGVMIANKKKYAIENTSHIMAATNGVYNAGYREAAADIYALPNLNNLIKMLSESHVEKIWNLSNLLAVKITINPTTVVRGQEVSLNAGCKNPETQEILSCNITWQLSDTVSKSGADIKHIFTTVGKHLVTANAIDSDGATNTETIEVDVLAFEPDISLQDPSGNILRAQSVYAYGDVPIGGSATAVFSVTNTGFSDLHIGEITSNNNVFRIVGLSTTTIAPNASTEFSVVFQPTTETNYEGTINITSNHPTQPNFPFKLSGKGVTSAGRWTVINGTTENSFKAARIITVLDNDIKQLKIRMFTSATEDYPQIQLTLKNYDINSNDRGNGEYNFDDLSQTTCLGFFATASNEQQQYCTSTADAVDENKATGTALVTSGSQVNGKKIIFTFDAITRACSSPTTCPRIEVSGDIYYQNETN